MHRVDKAGEDIAILPIRVGRVTVVNTDLKLRQLMSVRAALTLLKGATGNESKTAKIKDCVQSAINRSDLDHQN